MNSFCLRELVLAGFRLDVFGFSVDHGDNVALEEHLDWYISRLHPHERVFDREFHLVPSQPAKMLFEEEKILAFLGILGRSFEPVCAVNLFPLPPE